MILPNLQLPPFAHRLKQANEQTLIFDEFRKKWVALTPEEWVRQHFVHLLVQLGYAKSRISLERGLQYERLAKRSDIVVYDATAQPYLLVECKAPDVPLNQNVLEQVARYNKTLNAPYVAISNGIKTFCFDVQHGQTHQLNSLPIPSGT